MDFAAGVSGWDTGVVGGLSLATAGLCAIAVLLLRPALQRYALARPNARSSHREPTPQGGGIAVLGAMILVLVPVMWPRDGASDFGELRIVLAAAVAVALIGALDDVRPMPPLPRLLLQGVAIGALLLMVSPEVRIAPFLPLWLERVAVFAALLWFVNLVNFMDGLDWMSVAEAVPIAAALLLAGALGALPWPAVLLAAALLGGMLGFAPFNRPVARVFLGDVGSLPLGLMLGWLLFRLAADGHLAAALLLPLYYLADASITLVRRLARGERFWEAHRTHFYQRATEGGFPVIEVVARVFTLNLALAGLALVTIIEPSAVTDAAALALGGALVAWLLLRFASGKRT